MPDDLAHLANDLRFTCQRVSRRVRYEGTDEIAPHLASVLLRLDEPRTPGELAEIERVSAPSMTRTVGCLADAGLVARTPHPTDGRQVVISRTPEGDALAARTRARRDSWMLQRIEDLPTEDLATLRRAVEILHEVAGR